MKYLKTLSLMTALIVGLSLPWVSNAQTPLPDTKVSLHQKSDMTASVDAPEAAEGIANIHLKYKDVSTDDTDDESSFERLVLKLRGLDGGDYSVYGSTATNGPVL